METLARAEQAAKKPARAGPALVRLGGLAALVTALPPGDLDAARHLRPNRPLVYQDAALGDSTRSQPHFLPRRLVLVRQRAVDGDVLVFVHGNPPPKSPRAERLPPSPSVPGGTRCPAACVQARPTEVSDAGLEHLQGLTELQALSLSFATAADAGLQYLKGLTKLRRLDLSGTKVADAGEHDLQKALPNVTIGR